MSAKTEQDVKQIQLLISILKNEVRDLRDRMEKLEAKTPPLPKVSYDKTLSIPKNKKKVKPHAQA